jgi:hypothetical protein
MAPEIVDDYGRVDEYRHQSLRVRRDPERNFSTVAAPLSSRPVQEPKAWRMRSRSSELERLVPYTASTASRMRAERDLPVRVASASSAWRSSAVSDI